MGIFKKHFKYSQAINALESIDSVIQKEERNGGSHLFSQMENILKSMLQK